MFLRQDKVISSYFSTSVQPDLYHVLSPVGLYAPSKKVFICTWGQPILLWQVPSGNLSSAWAESSRDHKVDLFVAIVHSPAYGWKLKSTTGHLNGPGRGWVYCSLISLCLTGSNPWWRAGQTAGDMSSWIAPHESELQNQGWTSQASHAV